MSEIESRMASQFMENGWDTGSTVVQVARLTENIKHLTAHFEKHAKDYQSKTGLYKKISRRKALLAYLKRNDPHRYRELIGELSLRDQV